MVEKKWKVVGLWRRGRCGCDGEEAALSIAGEGTDLPVRAATALE